MKEMRATENLNIVDTRLLPSPRKIKEALPLSDSARTWIVEARQQICRIMDGTDHRFLVIVGPCSIHDEGAAREYGRRLRKLADEVKDNLLIVMRVYFEKPRTVVGWKGFINDPDLDDSFKVDEGLRRARRLLQDFAEMGIATGSEALDPISPQYLSDTLCWTAIGARTTESQTHREMASGLSTPVGFKNGTDGNLNVAINALKSCAAPHHFLGIDQNGQCAVIETAGNPYGHVILRGGGKKPNYDAASVAETDRLLKAAQARDCIVVDCSHANSGKDPEKQPEVLKDCVKQIRDGNRSIIGVMLESNLHAGRQDLGDDPSDLDYGVSITDGCIGWETTEKILREANRELSQALKDRANSPS